MSEPPISAKSEDSGHNIQTTEEVNRSAGVDVSTSEAGGVYENGHEPITKTSSRQSSDSLGSEDPGNRGRESPSINRSHGYPDFPEHKISWRSRLPVFWLQNKGVFLVLLAQLFAAFMNVMTRLLERHGPHGEGMHTFQVGYNSFNPLLLH